jgi:hypothetical protein
LRRYEHVPLATLRFDGERFAGHAIDVECAPELQHYRTLVLECAKELWRRRNPARERLPKGFEEGFALAFADIRDGSASVPLLRRIAVEEGQLSLTERPPDEFDEAAELIDQTIDAAGREGTLPAELPRNVIPLFRDFGATLRPAETLFTQASRSQAEAAYSVAARERLANWTEATYEDVVDLFGEVRMAALDGAKFSITLAGGRTVPGRFTAEQEALVLEALSRHNEVRLRIRGLAEFDESDRILRRICRVDSAEILTGTDLPYDESVRPIWQTLSEIGEAVPPEDWAEVPTDYSKRLDDYLYGGRGDR